MRHDNCRCPECCASPALCNPCCLPIPQTTLCGRPVDSRSTAVVVARDSTPKESHLAPKRVAPSAVAAAAAGRSLPMSLDCKPRTALVLAGAGAKGAFEAGCLDLLARAGITISRIAASTAQVATVHELASAGRSIRQIAHSVGLTRSVVHSILRGRGPYGDGAAPRAEGQKNYVWNDSGANLSL